MRSRTIILLLIAASLVVPAVATAWGARGSAEPDTTFDATKGMMFTTADTTADDITKPGGRVYFSAFQGYNIPPNVPVVLNANEALLGTSFKNTPNQVYAMFGVWKDCNNDGMIGFGDKALFEYRATLLLSTTICPPGPGPAVTTTGHDAPKAFNDGTWVHEFIPIGYDARPTPGQAGNNPYKYYDLGARVWGDVGEPNTVFRGLTCWIRPVPVGTYDSVGSIFDYVDCHTQNVVGENVTAVLTTATLNDEWNTVRGKHNPYGHSSDPSYVQVFDCSQPQLVPVIRQGATGVGVSRPKVPPSFVVPDPNYDHGDASPGGTMNETLTGLADCNRSNNNAQSEGTVSHAPYSFENDDIVNQNWKTTGKIQTSVVLSFYAGFKKILGVAGQAGTYAPWDAGVGIDLAGTWISASLAVADNNFATNNLRANPPVIRPVHHWTYYAYVTPAKITEYNLVLPSGATVKDYAAGTNECGSNIGQSGVQPSGWNCNPADWYLTDAKWPSGARKMAEIAYDTSFTCTEGDTSCGNFDPGDPAISKGNLIVAAFPGQDYQMIDVDCYDASVNGARQLGAHWGILTGSKCI